MGLQVTQPQSRLSENKLVLKWSVWTVIFSLSMMLRLEKRLFEVLGVILYSHKSQFSSALCSQQHYTDQIN
jgi:hypothetical protein